MSYKTKTIFPEEWSFFVKNYRNYLNEVGNYEISSYKILDLIEMGVLFGERVFEMSFERYVEIGCGMALPSITISKLGGNNVIAFDIDMTVLNFTKKNIERCKANIDIGLMDFNFSRIDSHKNEIWIAEKPNNWKTFENFELNILKKAISKNVNIAIAPTINYNNSKLSVKNYIQKCKNIELRLKKYGYEVENAEITKGFPIRWVIGTIK